MNELYDQCEHDQDDEEEAKRDEAERRNPELHDDRINKEIEARSNRHINSFAERSTTEDFVYTWIDTPNEALAELWHLIVANRDKPEVAVAEAIKAIEKYTDSVAAFQQ